MSALNLIRPLVTAMRVIASVNVKFTRELKLPPYIRSLGLTSADSDNATYIAVDEAAKQAVVEVVYGHSLYVGAAYDPSSTAGEALIMLGGSNPAEVRTGLGTVVTSIEDGAAFQWVNDAENTAFPAHIVSRIGSYLSSTAGTTLGDPTVHLMAPSLEAAYGIDVALKSADVQLVIYVPSPSRTDYSVVSLTDSQAVCKATCSAFTDAVLEIARNPIQCVQRKLPMINALGLLEVDGMIAAIDVTDAMLETASVRLSSHEALDPGRLMLAVEGGLAVCRTVPGAGCAAAMRTRHIVSHKEIGRPDDDTQWLLTGFNRQPKQPVKESDVPVIVAESIDKLLALLASTRQGMAAGEMAAHFGWPLEEARNVLKQFLPARTLHKRSSRYHLEPH